MTEIPLKATYGNLPRTPAIEHPSFKEYEAGLLAWQKRWPDHITVEERGRSLENHPIYMARVTDRTVSDDDKQALLLSAAHGAGEVSSVVGILHFLKWLLSEDPEAIRIRRGLIVITIPIIEVDTYISNRETGDEKTGNKAGVPIYNLNAWTWEGVPTGVHHPEAQAFWKMMEEYQPDAHFDIHGHPWCDVGMHESIGVSTPRIGRCFDPAIVAEVERAVDSAGYCTIREEIQAGRLCVACGEKELGVVADHYEVLPDETDHYKLMITPVMLSYHRYHSISFVCELYWMGSIMAACRRFAELGLETGFSEFFRGYPNNLVESRGSLLISAWGDTAARRRKSRVELWNRGRKSLALRMGGPVIMRDMTLASCATSREGARLVGSEGYEKFIANIQGDARFNAEALKSFLEEYPPTMFSRESQVFDQDYPPIQNGLAMRVGLQYSDAKLNEVRLNGHLLKESPTDGYLVHHNQGTMVQVNIPPDKVHDLHVVTIRYDSPQRPLQGFTAEDWVSEEQRIPVR